MASFDALPRRALPAASARRSARSARRRSRVLKSLDTLRGAEIGPADWDAMWHFYQDTGARKWGQPYLTRAFFDLVGDRDGRHEPDVSRAARRRADRRRAQSHRRGYALWPLLGRESRKCPSSTSSSCYYRAIDWAIEHGLATGPGRRAGRA